MPMIPGMARPDPNIGPNEPGNWEGGSEEFTFLAQGLHGHMGVNLETEGAIASDQSWRSNARKPYEADESGAFPSVDHAVHEPYGPDVGN